jgi:hypothetical protein
VCVSWKLFKSDYLQPVAADEAANLALRRQGITSSSHLIEEERDLNLPISRGRNQGVALSSQAEAPLEGVPGHSYLLGKHITTFIGNIIDLPTATVDVDCEEGNRPAPRVLGAESDSEDVVRIAGLDKGPRRLDRHTIISRKRPSASCYGPAGYFDRVFSCLLISASLLGGRTSTTDKSQRYN